MLSLRVSLLTEWPERRLLHERTPQWITHSEFSELRQLLGAALSSFWKILHPVKAFRLLKFRRWAGEGNRLKLNHMFLERRYLDPGLADLNAEQRKAVMVQEDRTLVIAGAGTGKTHTMVAKAHDTVRIGIARPKEIAFVTFTRAAADEIRQRCTELSGIEIGTIHHLAREIIVQAEGKRPKLSPLADERHKLDRLDKIERWLIEAVQDDPSLLVDIHSRKAAAERCQSPTVTAPPFVAVPPGRVRVRSWGEAQIALTLYLAGVAYEYEREFSVPTHFRSRPGAGYLPDFFLPDDPNCAEAEIAGGIWFEHFAHDRSGRLPSEWSEEERQQYETDRGWKEDLHRRLDTRFVFTEYGDIERCRASGESFPALVLQRIGALGRSSVVLPTPAQIQGLIDELKANDEGARHLRATHEVDDWIRTYRQQLPGAPTTQSAIWDREMLQEANALRRADYVIFVDTGPPRAAESGREKALARALSPLRYGGANVGEERRIWYVALTRARHKVYVISDTGHELSPLFDELMRNEDGAYDVSSTELADYLKSTALRVPCPRCAENGENSAVLLLRSGRNGPFASCTSFIAGQEHRCGHTERACETCGRGLMARDGNGRASCSNPDCSHMAPLCRCSPPKPMVVRRNKTTREPFWGCQSFGTGGSCRETRSLNDPARVGSRGARRRVRASRSRS